MFYFFFFFFSSRRRHTRYWRDWSSDVCSSDLVGPLDLARLRGAARGVGGEAGGRRVIEAALIGVAAGIIAGLFGVGGGTLFVPALTIFLGLSHIDAEATSLLAIVPVAI